MKKSIKLIFSILLIISIVGASPIVLNRNKIENSNNIYQIAVSARDVENIRTDEEKQHFYDRLKDANVDTLTFKNMSISDLSEYRNIKYMTVSQYLDDKENFDYNVKDFIPKYADKDDIVIMISKKDFSKEEIEIIKTFLGDFEIMEQKDDIFLYIDEPMEIVYKDNHVKNFLTTSRFFVDRTAIKEAKDAGMNPMLSIYNSSDANIQKILFNQIMDLSKEFGIKKIQILGSDVIGFPNNIDKYLSEFKKNGISIVTTEFETKAGLNAYVSNGQQNLIRGHQINLNALNLSNDEFTSRIARAVKERNMRVIVVTDFINYTNSNTITKSIDSLISNLKEAQRQLSKGYVCSEAKSFDIMNRQNRAELFTSIASASLVALLVLSILKKSNKSIVMSIVSFIAVFVGALLISKTQSSVGIKVYALAMSIIGACAAVIIPYKSKFNSIILKFGITSTLATLSGLLVASIMYGTAYMLKLKVFSGIKVLYIMPPLLIAIWVIIDSGVLKNLNFRKNGQKEFKLDKHKIISTIKSIKWYHIVLVIVVAVGAVVYIRRSGNSGNVSDLELQIRRVLEEILYVRPRTKEFMLGYPAVLIAFYMYKHNVKYAQYALIIASIATMSTVNTFTHLHTPVIYSLLRTVYGIILGLIVGLIYIGAFKKVKKFVKKER